MAARKVAPAWKFKDPPLHLPVPSNFIWYNSSEAPSAQILVELTKGSSLDQHTYMAIKKAKFASISTLLLSAYITCHIYLIGIKPLETRLASWTWLLLVSRKALKKVTRRDRTGRQEFNNCRVAINAALRLDFNGSNFRRIFKQLGCSLLWFFCNPKNENPRSSQKQKGLFA